MQTEGTMQRIRQGILAAMSRWSSTEPHIEQETILVQDGHYCGRRFRGREIQAVWFLEEQQIKFYDADGRLLEVTTADELLELARRDVA